MAKKKDGPGRRLIRYISNAELGTVLPSLLGVSGRRYQQLRLRQEQDLVLLRENILDILDIYSTIQSGIVKGSREDSGYAQPAMQLPLRPDERWGRSGSQGPTWRSLLTPEAFEPVTSGWQSG
jgi:hypothetical protein